MDAQKILQIFYKILWDYGFFHTTVSNHAGYVKFGEMQDIYETRQSH